MSETLARTADGFSYRPGTADEWILRERSYRRLLDRVVAGDRVLDLGGYIGSFAADAARRGGDVWAFEPAASNYALLALNGETFRFHAANAAVLDHDPPDHRVTFYQAPDGRRMPCGTVDRPKRGYTEVLVPAVDLRDVQLAWEPHHVKIDVEGYETKLLARLNLDAPALRTVAVEFELRGDRRAAALAADERLRAAGFTVRQRALADRSPTAWVAVLVYHRDL